MRIAYVTETWPPEINGVANSAFRTVSFLRARSHQVDVVRPRQHRKDCEDGVTLVAGVAIPLYPDLRMGFPVTRFLMRHWRNTAPDLVHVATEGPLGWAAVTAATRLGIPVTSDFRTRFDVYARSYAFGFLERVVAAYLRAFHNRCALTFVPTDALRAELAVLGFDRLEVCARGVDCTAFDPALRSEELRRSWGASGPVALYVGRLAKEKNLALLAQTMAALEAAVPEIKNVVVGEGPERHRLAKTLPNALFLGVQRGAELAAIYASSDLFVFPSQSETFGNVTLEALASGLPVVAFDMAAAHLYIHGGENGALVPCEEDAAFVQASVCLAEQVIENRSMALAARQIALTADWHAVLRAFESTLIHCAIEGSIRDHAILV